jgi:hypothetical protein
MQDSTPASHSTFVTVLAWVFIICSGFGVFGALLQNIMINVMMPAIVKAQASSGQPTQVFPIGVFRVMGLLFLALSCFTLYAAWALLKRRNWARRTFIVLLSCGIGFNVLWALAFGAGVSFTHAPSTGANSIPPEMRALFSTMVGVFVVFALAMSVLYGWLIRRLCSATVKAEFTSAAVAP